jgi:hypothetical protein
MQTLALAAPFVLLVVPVLILCIWHVIVRKQASAALAQLYRAKGDAIPQARQNYWDLDRLQKRIAIPVLVLWVITTVGWRWIGPDISLSWVGPALSSLGLIVMYMMTVHLNMKDTEERIQADVRRRYPIPGEND